MVKPNSILEELEAFAKEKTKLSPYGRAKREFSIHKEKIIEALNQGYSKKTIFSFLQEYESLSISQASFYNLCKQLIEKDEDPKNTSLPHIDQNKTSTDTTDHAPHIADNSLNSFQPKNNRIKEGCPIDREALKAKAEQAFKALESSFSLNKDSSIPEI